MGDKVGMGDKAVMDEEAVKDDTATALLWEGRAMGPRLYLLPAGQ
jgi:hypothetical protein